MKRVMKIILILLVVIVLLLVVVLRSDGGGAAALNAITPSKTFTVEKDISYGDHARQSTDFYKAANPKADTPMIVFIHGGGWTSGDKSMYKFLAEGLTSEGYDVALPNYRIYPEVKYPAFLDDSAKAIAAIAKKEPRRPLVLIGHSAGAYNALMMAFQPNHLSDAGFGLCENIAGIVSLASPTGALPAEQEPTISIFPDRFMGDDGALRHVDRPLPPLLLINGKDDTSVHPENAVELGEALKGRDVATVKIYPDTNHVDVVKQFSRHFEKQGETKADVIRFIDNLPGKSNGTYCK